MIKREIQSTIEKHLFKNKVVILYGARQVGKTTLVKEIAKKIDNSVYFNCEEPSVRSALIDKSSLELKNFIGNHTLVILDEAQSILNIGLILKLLVDTYPEVQILATGSSSFDLANEVVEPLTGRKFEFHLHPISISELVRHNSRHEVQHSLNSRLIYGMYPEVLSGDENAEYRLKEIARSYVYKDILKLDKIRNTDALDKLLKALALQIGSEVSYNELANIVGIDKETVQRYIKILEQAFIIFRLKPYHKNIRTELRKLRKIYFVDVGIRNALIENLNPIDLRNDVGALWENFLISERMKYLTNNNKDAQMYFWRTQAQQELDYIEVENNVMSAFEFKWSDKRKLHIPKAFKDAYPSITVDLINKDAAIDFVTSL